MSDRQELIDWLRHWKHEVQTTREREEMIEAMRDAATALEEAQGVPVAWMYEHDGMVHDGDHPPVLTTRRWVSCDEPYTETPLYAAPAAPTRDEQDAKRGALHDAIERAAGELPDGWQIDVSVERGAGWVALHNEDGDTVDVHYDDLSLPQQVNAAIDAALAEPKR